MWLDRVSHIRISLFFTRGNIKLVFFSVIKTLFKIFHNLTANYNFQLHSFKIILHLFLNRKKKTFENLYPLVQ